MDQNQSSSNTPMSPPSSDDESVSKAAHLAWCKKRALDLCDAGDPRQAFLSMMRDMREHKETAQHAGLLIGPMLVMSGSLNDEKEVRNWITGFN